MEDDDEIDFFTELLGGGRDVVPLDQCRSSLQVVRSHPRGRLVPLVSLVCCPCYAISQIILHRDTIASLSIVNKLR
jgi:hypothetical protein